MAFSKLSFSSLEIPSYIGAERQLTGPVAEVTAQPRVQSDRITVNVLPAKLAGGGKNVTSYIHPGFVTEAVDSTAHYIRGRFIRGDLQEGITPWKRILAGKYGNGNDGSFENRSGVRPTLWMPTGSGVVKVDVPPVHELSNDRTSGTVHGASTADDPEQRRLALEHFKLLLSLILPHLRLSDAMMNVALETASRKLSAPDAHLRRDVITICESLVEIIETNAKIRALPDHKKYQRLAKTAWGHVNPHRSKRYRAAAVVNVLGVDNSPLTRFREMTWEDICSAFGFDARDYQDAWQEILIGRISSGQDRAIIAAPYQVGKTLSMLPLAVVVHAAFPERFAGKTILLIAPQIAVLDNIKEDIAAMGLDLKVGVIDSTRKDFGAGYDVVVASAMTLGRDENLMFLEPDHYGLVIVDEAPFVYGQFGHKIVRKLGFLNRQGKIEHHPKRFLLGYSADPFTLEKVFGEGARIDNFPIGWFVEHGYLHNPVGVQVRYDASREITFINDAGETIEVPKLGHTYVDDVYRVYKARFDGQKVMINCPNIIYAELVASYFTYMEGEGFAYANHSKKSHDENHEAEVEFVKDGKLRVMVGIARLAVGFRAKGAVAVINSYLTTSIRRYGQRLGRILGIHDGEPQRVVHVVDMVPSTHKNAEATGITLPTLLGFAGYPGDNVDFVPFEIAGARRSSPTQVKVYEPSFEALAGQQGNIEFVPAEGGRRTFLYPTRFPELLTRSLNTDFGADVGAMATALGIEREILDQYLCGRLPTYAIMLLFAGRNSEPDIWEQAWEDDSLELLAGLHPFDRFHSDATVQSLVVVVRRSSLRFVYEGSAIKPPQGKAFNSRERTMLLALVQAKLLNRDGVFLGKIFPDRLARLCSACSDEIASVQAVIDGLIAFERANRERLDAERQVREAELDRVPQGVVEPQQGEEHQQKEEPAPEAQEASPDADESVVEVSHSGDEGTAVDVATLSLSSFVAEPESASLSVERPAVDMPVVTDHGDGEEREEKYDRPIETTMVTREPSGIAQIFWGVATYLGFTRPAQQEDEAETTPHGFGYYWRRIRNRIWKK